MVDRPNIQRTARAYTSRFWIGIPLRLEIVTVADSPPAARLVASRALLIPSAKLLRRCFGVDGASRRLPGIVD